MSYVIFCRSERAKEPYVLADLRKKLYTIEELCYYIYDNTVLCGEELSNPRLVQWIASECGHADLSESIRIILEKDPRPERIAAQIFAYTDYLGKNEREAVCEKIRKYSQLNMNERKKMRADHYVVAGQYAEAIRDYEEMLLEKRYDSEKEKHHILYDIGCCYGCMFYYDLAYDWFMKAAESDCQKEEDLLAALYCRKMVLNEDEYAAFIKTHREFEIVAPNVEKKVRLVMQEYENRPETAALDKEFMRGGTGNLHEIIERKLTAYKAEI